MNPCLAHVFEHVFLGTWGGWEVKLLISDRNILFLFLQISNNVDYDQVHWIGSVVMSFPKSENFHYEMGLTCYTKDFSDMISGPVDMSILSIAKE